MQTEELAYVIVTPYSIRNHAPAASLAVDFPHGSGSVGGRMFAPSAELATRYANTTVTEINSRHRATQELIREYVLKILLAKKNGQQRACYSSSFADGRGWKGSTAR